MILKPGTNLTVDNIEEYLNERKRQGLCQYGYDDLIFQMGLIRSRQNRADNFNTKPVTIKSWEALALKREATKNG